MNNKLFVIFVNYNSGKQLEEGVKALSKHKSVSGIIIVDNASTDNSLFSFKKISLVKAVIKNTENLGFNKAMNMGIKKALTLGADCVMPLDFDLDFSSDFISKLLSVKADIVAPVLKFKRNGKWVYDYGGRVNWIIGRTTHLESDVLLPLAETADSSSDRQSKYWYDFVSGGCTIIAKKVIEKIGFLNEDYFVYYGDTDFALRARKAGFKVKMDPNTIVHHKLEITKTTKNRRKISIVLNDNLVFINKWIKFYFKPLAYLYLFLLKIKVEINMLQP